MRSDCILIQKRVAAQWNHSNVHCYLFCWDAVTVKMSTLGGFDLVMGSVVNTQIRAQSLFQMMRSAVKTRKRDKVRAEVFFDTQELKYTTQSLFCGNEYMNNE